MFFMLLIFKSLNRKYLSEYFDTLITYEFNRPFKILVGGIMMNIHIRINMNMKSIIFL